MALKRAQQAAIEMAQAISVSCYSCLVLISCLFCAQGLLVWEEKEREILFATVMYKLG